MSRTKLNMKNIEKVAQQVLLTEGVERMRRVKDAANNSLMHETEGEAGATGEDYQLSVEGKKRLRRKDMVTVITTTAAAMRDNAANNTLVNNFHLAEGE